MPESKALSYSINNNNKTHFNEEVRRSAKWSAQNTNSFQLFITITRSILTILLYYNNNKGINISFCLLKCEVVRGSGWWCTQRLNDFQYWFYSLFFVNCSLWISVELPYSFYLFHFLLRLMCSLEQFLIIFKCIGECEYFVCLSITSRRIH